MNVTWIDCRDEFANELQDAITESLEEAGRSLQGLMQDTISKPTNRKHRSPVGGPPGKETDGRHPGLAYDSVAMSDVALNGEGHPSVSVGVAGEAETYMAMHERGKRPWLQASLDKNPNALAAAFLAPDRR